MAGFPFPASAGLSVGRSMFVFSSIAFIFSPAIIALGVWRGYCLRFTRLLCGGSALYLSPRSKAKIPARCRRGPIFCIVFSPGGVACASIAQPFPLCGVFCPGLAPPPACPSKSLAGVGGVLPISFSFSIVRFVLPVRSVHPACPS